MNIKSRLKTSSVALLMVAVVALLIIPLPTAILDFMFILYYNVCNKSVVFTTKMRFLWRNISQY